MRSTTLGLLLLVSVRAVFNMGGAARGEGGRTTPLSTPTTDPRLRSAHGTPAKFRNVTPNSGTPADARPSPAPLASVPSPRPDPPNVGPASDPELPEETPRDVPAAPGPEPPTATRDSIPTVDPAVFNKRRYRSPRVLFSAHPPDAQGGAGAGAGARVRRRAGQTRHRGVYSVCDSVSNWVGNKTSAVDIRGNEVAVLPDVRINNIVKKQYFFETTCHGPARPARAGGGCLGIDSRSWNSYCTNTHTFVLAMTSFKSLVAWRLVRINAACVCVLSRKSWRH